MKLESIINFEIDQTVKYNPENHGFKFLGAYGKVKDRVGVVKNILTEGYINENGYPSQRRTGRICVLWNKDFSCKIINYKHLIIV
jgi:hypothetical protein